MKQSRYSEPQILGILRQAKGGIPVSDLCRKHGMSDASFYKWRAKYGGIDASMISSMKAMDYMLKRRISFTRGPDDGRICLDQQCG